MKKVLTLMLALVLTLSLAACGNKEDQANLADAVQKLSLDVSDPTAVTASIELPATGLLETTITWSSSNTDVISNEGVVTRPAIGSADETVVLTATITLGKEKTTKEFTLKVLEDVPVVVMDIARFNSSAVKDDSVVELTGIVVGTIDGKGFYIADSSGSTYIYEGKDATVEVGDNVTVKGTKDTYYNVVEMVSVSSVVVLTTNDITTPAFTATTIADIYLNDNTDSSIYNAMINVGGYINLRGNVGYENVFLSWYDADLNLQDVEVYYKSGGDDKIAELKLLDGKLASTDAIFMDYYSSAPSHFRIAVQIPGSVTEGIAITDQEMANLTVAFASSELVNNSSVDYNLTLGTTTFTGNSVVWTSSDEAAITTAGVITQVSGSESVVTLTATADVNGVTAVKTFTITVMDADASAPITVGAALDLTDGDDALVQGVVTGFTHQNYPLLQDSEGNGILAYGYAYNGNVGDEIVLRGTLSTHFELRQLADAVFVEVVQTDVTVTPITTATVAEIATLTDFANTQCKLYTVELTIVDLDTTNYTTFVGDGTTVISLYTVDHYIRDYYSNGDKLTATFFISGSGEAYVNIELQYVDSLTNVQKLEVVTDMLSVPTTTIIDLDLVAGYPGYDTVITWTSNNAAVTDAGVVTRPAIGEANATGTLVASVVVGTDAAVELTFDVTVNAFAEATSDTPDLFFSEYVEGNGDNKAFEIYNPTGVTIDLSAYKIDFYHNDEDFIDATYTLTGTLASGDVLVFCADGISVSSICDVSQVYEDETGDVTHFNGNDSLVLLKDGVRIDVIGTPEDNPAGGSWTVGTGATADFTLVRNATVVNGVLIFDATEWTVLAVDTLTGLGDHTCDQPTS